MKLTFSGWFLGGSFENIAFFLCQKMAKKAMFDPKMHLFGQILVFEAKNWVKRTATVGFLQLQGQTTIFFVISGLKIEKTGPGTAKISPKMEKKAIFDRFSVKYGSFHLKTGSKERQR